MEREKPFTNLNRAANELGLSPAWLRAEAEAGRIPVLRVGRRFLFNIVSVQEALLKRMSDSKSLECAHA